MAKDTKPVMHKIRAYLHDNPLTDDPNDFSARVNSERSLSVREICESATARGGADVPAASMAHATELFFKEMAYQLCDGYSVNTGYFTATPLIKGVFNDPKEQFNSEKHSILFQFNQGETLRKELPTIEVEIMGVADSGASIMQVTDMKTGSVNELLTPNRNLKINGNKLKIAGDNPNVGVYFVNQSTQVRMRVIPTDIVINNPSEVMIVIPTLPKAAYRVEIVTQYAVGSILKEPRTALFDKVLTVKPKELDKAFLSERTKGLC